MGLGGVGRGCGEWEGLAHTSGRTVRGPAGSGSTVDLLGIHRGQQFAQQMQQQNPEFVEQIRSQVVRSRTPSASHEEQQE